VVGTVSDLFRRSSVASYDRRIRASLASGKVEDARRLLERARARHPMARTFADLVLLVERAHAREEIRELDRRVTLTGDPRAYERLIALYDELQMPEESRRTLKAYAGAHPDLDSCQLLLGERHLKAYFDDLLARDAHQAQEHLLRAARLNPQAIKPRLLLAELYFCVDARGRLARVGESLKHIVHEEQSLEAVFAAISSLGEARSDERLDGLFERIEVEGRLPREPADWPLATPRHAEARLKEERAVQAARSAVRSRDAEEVVVLRRNGTVLVHARADGTDHEPEDVAASEHDDDGLIGVVRTVNSTIVTQAREFDLGAFQRCVLEGAFGLVVCGRWGNVVAAARRATRSEPLRLWERLCRRLDGAAVEEPA